VEREKVRLEEMMMACEHDVRMLESCKIILIKEDTGNIRQNSQKAKSDTVLYRN
jgi:hypothetical protein